MESKDLKRLAVEIDYAFLQRYRWEPDPFNTGLAFEAGVAACRSEIEAFQAEMQRRGLSREAEVALEDIGTMLGVAHGLDRVMALRSLLLDAHENKVEDE